MQLLPSRDIVLPGACTVGAVVASDDTREGARLTGAVRPSRGGRCANLQACNGSLAVLKLRWRRRSKGQEGASGEEKRDLRQHDE